MSKRTQSINHLFFCWRCDSLACRNRILIFRKKKGIMWTCVHNVWGKISIWTWWTPCFFHHIGFGVTHIWHIMPFYHDLFKPGDAFFLKWSFFFSERRKKRFQGAEAGLWQTLQKNNLFSCRTAAFPDFWVFSFVSRFGCVFCVCLCLSVCFCLCVWCVILLCVWVSVYLYVVVCVCASGGRGRRVVGTGEAGRGQGWVVRVLGRRLRAGWGWVMVAKGIIVHWGLGAAGQGA